MSENARKRSRTIIVILLLLIIAALLLLVRCSRETETTAEPAPTGAVAEGQPSVPVPDETTASPIQEERLTPATLQGPAEVGAGAKFRVMWTGPANHQDYITIVRLDAAPAAYANYGDTNDGSPLELTAPVEPGAWELRYVTAQSRTVLARAPIAVIAAEATLSAPAEVVLGTEIEVHWTGPNNTQDYITVVKADARDGHYGNYRETKAGSPLRLKLPPEDGEAELRYMTGQGGKVLARRAIKILAPEIRISAPSEVIAGSEFSVEWVGPNNEQDYITVVAKDTKDGQYGNYRETKAGSPLAVRAPIMEGAAELRYMTGQGAKVLGRRPIRIVAAKVTLSAPAQIASGADVTVEWEGPNHPSDYITIVPKNTPDGQYRKYAETRRGSPVKIGAPTEAGGAEIRYMAGQGSVVLARRPIRVVEP